MEINKKFLELAKDSEFVSKVEKTTNLDEFKQAFIEKGVDVEKEINGMVDNGILSKDGEISEDALESVSGGLKIDIVKWPFQLFACTLYYMRRDGSFKMCICGFHKGLVRR